MLACLELFGFKSFADRTAFDFASGVTAVVGPNGSGKSNVVDAIKWVLGDQSAKSLRGKEMTDVIFNGAVGRKPSNFAESTLTFDNSSGFLPTPDRKVSVGRRLWRNGDSEYLLNNEVVRLKDIRDLFLGTGAGASAYAIIEQGRVDQIIQANAAGRRAVFEEAAGVSRYKSRRGEALKRLEKVEQNLLRLTGIVNELEGRLATTRTQATKAAKFREYSQDLESWWLGLAADDYRHASTARGTFAATLDANQTELDRVAAEQATLDGAIAGLDHQLATAEEALRAAERQASANREQNAGHEAAVSYQTTRLGELEAEVVRLRRQWTALSIRCGEAAAERAHNTGVLAAGERELLDARKAIAIREAELHELADRAGTDRQQISTDRGLQLDRLRRVSDAENRLAGLAAERDAVAAAADAAAKRLEAVGNDLLTATAAAAERRTAAEQAESNLRTHRGRAADLHAAREKLAADREQLAAEVAALREHKSATAARIAVLEDLVARGEGFGIGVREILRRARTIAAPPWDRIHGTVADLLDVDLADAPLLEVALGERAQLIVIDHFETLLPYLNRSSSRITGRVGFLSDTGLPGDTAFESNGQRGASEASTPEQTTGSDLAGVRYIEAVRARLTGPVESVQPRDAEPPRPAGRLDLRGLPGVLKRADELVRPGSAMPHLAARLLADTWLVESLETALRLATGLGRGQRFVTPAGELLDADGTLAVGTLRAESAVVSRRSELLGLRDELAAIDRRLAAAARQRELLTTSQENLSTRFTEAETAVRAAADALHRAAAQFAEADGRRGRLADERDALAEESADRHRRLERLGRSLVGIEADRAAAKHDLEALETGLSIAEHSAAEADAARAAAERSLAAGRLELAKNEERLTALRSSLVRLEREASGRTTQLADAGRRLDAALHKRSEATLQLLNTAALLTEAALGGESHGNAVRTAAAGVGRLKKERSGFAATEAALRSRRRTLLDARHGAELAVRELDHRLATQADRIREEYGRELADLVAEDRSAVRLLEEEQATAAAPSDSGPLTFDQSRPELEARVDKLRKRLKNLGAVNADSLADLDELETRYTRLSSQLQDLAEAKRTLEDIIRRINVESRRMFAETFETIRGHFQDLFRKLFGGGEGDIVLEDPSDLLESGVDIIARPPGKELRSLSLLSGGEKAMVCVALLLAIFRTKPSPFCLLDEVDAPLDEANIGRFVTVLKEFTATTQFVMITHRKPSMCEADVLYGVTMEQAGVSKRLNVRFDDVAEDGSFKSARRAA